MGVSKGHVRKSHMKGVGRVQRREPGYAMAVVKGMTGLSERQIRYYDAMGLVSPMRTPGGHRLYSQRDVERLLEIKSLIARGLKVSEVRERLREREEPPTELVSDRESFFLRKIRGPAFQGGVGIRERDPLGTTSVKSLYPMEKRPEIMKSVDGLRARKGEEKTSARNRDRQGGSPKETGRS
ncbi:MAG: MerR family transcriptional regulator [Bacillota bacterium]|jgi:MerR family glutamine synthetase transcriptional repressor